MRFVEPGSCRTASRRVGEDFGFVLQVLLGSLSTCEGASRAQGHEGLPPAENRAQTLLRDETDAERRKRLATIASQAFRAHELISDMMLFAKPPELHCAEVELSPLIDTVLLLWVNVPPLFIQSPSILNVLVPSSSTLSVLMVKSQST